MVKKWETVLVLVLLCLFVIRVEAALAVSAKELLENAELYDGKEIIYKGEVIGDIMLRGESAWVNVRDDTGVIGIFCPRDLVGEIKYPGSYQYRGDLVSVRGIFHHSCSQHGGDSDIHAERITLLQQGEPLAHPLEPQKVQASIILSAIVLVLAIIYLIVRRFR